MSFFTKKSKMPPLDSMNMEQLLFEADTQQDPKVIHEALRLAENLEPDNLDIQRRLLLQGRLHERSPRKMDFSIIKCYLLHAFEHPEAHQMQAQQDMARELFDDERLKRCLTLADDAEAFLRGYLEDLSRDYMRIFVASDNSHIPRVFGISFKGTLQRYLAQPARDIIMNIFSSPYLSQEEARVLARAFYRAFYDYAHGEVRELDSQLGVIVRAQLH